MRSVELHEDNAGGLSLLLTGTEYDLWLRDIVSANTFREDAAHLLTVGPSDWPYVQVYIPLYPQEAADADAKTCLQAVCDERGYAGLTTYQEIDRNNLMVAYYDETGWLCVYGTPRTLIHSLPHTAARAYLGPDAPPLG